jgi:hypothetical protein
VQIQKVAFGWSVPGRSQAACRPPLAGLFAQIYNLSTYKGVWTLDSLKLNGSTSNYPTFMQYMGPVNIISGTVAGMICEPPF